MTPPRVSSPRDRGVTSRSTMSFNSPSPDMMPACTAAPTATASSGLTLILGSFPKYSFTFFCTRGTLVDPPMRMTSSMSLLPSFASDMAFLHGSNVDSTRSYISFSKSALVISIFRCFGPEASAVTKGRLILVDVDVESSFFAFSAASFNL